MTVVVMIDDEFSPIETARIIVGVDSWVDAVGKENLAIRYGRVRDPFDKTAPEGVLYFSRKKQISDLVIPCHGGYLGCWKQGQRNIDLAAEDIRGYELARVAAHEFGHAMGLDHHEPDSIMGPSPDKMSEHPGKWDIKEYCRLNPCVSGGAPTKSPR